jgi:hypothetical protein
VLANPKPWCVGSELGKEPPAVAAYNPIVILAAPSPKAKAAVRLLVCYVCGWVVEIGLGQQGLVNRIDPGRGIEPP